MIPWSAAVHRGGYRRVVAVTSAQSGKTDSMLDIIGARLDQRPAPILYVGPTKEFLTDQFEPRLMALLDEADTLANKVIRGRRMKKTLKHVAGVRVRLAHAGSSTALKSDPAALALIDEYDEMMVNVKGQGDVLGLVEARGETYADFVTAITSTPARGLVEIEPDEASGLAFWARSAPDDLESPIWKLWQEGTRHHWAWPCKHCRIYFIPRFKQLRWPERATPAQAKQAATLVRRAAQRGRQGLDECLGHNGRAGADRHADGRRPTCHWRARRERDAVDVDLRALLALCQLGPAGEDLPDRARVRRSRPDPDGDECGLWRMLRHDRLGRCAGLAGDHGAPPALPAGRCAGRWSATGHGCRRPEVQPGLCDPGLWSAGYILADRQRPAFRADGG
jgi:phage terminase large subunit GpA-like protein